MKYLDKSFTVALSLSKCLPFCKCPQCRKKNEEKEKATNSSIEESMVIEPKDKS